MFPSTFSTDQDFKTLVPVQIAVTFISPISAANIISHLGNSTQTLLCLSSLPHPVSFYLLRDSSVHSSYTLL